MASQQYRTWFAAETIRLAESQARTDARNQRDVEARAERLAWDAAVRAASAEQLRQAEEAICPHGVAGTAECLACDPGIGSGDTRRPRCPHGRFTLHGDSCAPCETGIVPTMTALRDADLSMWRHPAIRHRYEMTRALIYQAIAAHRPRRPLVALSGGKDSLVTLALVRMVLPRVEVLWTDDELEYAESVEFIAHLERMWDLDLTVRLSPAIHADWFRPWTDRPFWREPRPDALPSFEIPTREWQAGEGYDLVFTGIRAQESRRRRDHLVTAGPLYDTQHGWRCCPLWDWSADDVWAAIGGLGLPYNPAYDVLETIGVERDRQRIGPLPLARRADLETGWPDMLAALETRYGPRFDWHPR